MERSWTARPRVSEAMTRTERARESEESREEKKED